MSKASWLPSAVILPILLVVTVGPGAAEQPNASLRVRMAGGEFSPHTPGQAPAWFRETRRPSVGVTGKRYLVAITREALGVEQRDRLQRAGAELLGYLPDHAYRLRIERGFEPTIRALPFVAWLGELPAPLKVQPALASEVGRADRPIELRVIVAEGEPATDGYLACAHRGLPKTARPAGRHGAWRVQVTDSAEANRCHTLRPRRVFRRSSRSSESSKLQLTLNQDGTWVHQSFVSPQTTDLR